MAERILTYLKALTEAQREEMRRDESVFLMGNDVRSGPALFMWRWTR